MNINKIDEEEKCRYCKKKIQLLEGQICPFCYIELKPEDILAEKFLPSFFEGGINLALDKFLKESTETKHPNLSSMIDTIQNSLELLQDLSMGDNIENIRKPDARERFNDLKQLSNLKEGLTDLQKREFTSLVQKSVNSYLENNENYSLIQPLMNKANKDFSNRISNGEGLSEILNDLNQQTQDLLLEINFFKNILSKSESR